MRPEEARIGTKVRVHEPLKGAELRGKMGTIARRLGGNSRYVAFDVLLEDGTRELLWHHELEVAEDGAGPERVPAAIPSTPNRVRSR